MGYFRLGLLGLVSFLPTLALGFSDADPVNWDGTPPSNYPVHGVDVSSYQAHPDWQALSSSGVDFAFIKATEGADRLDEAFSYNWAATAAAGVKHGAYHFYYFCSTPQEQADWFIRNVPRENGMLPPVVDVELNPDSPTCRIQPSVAEAQDVILRFMNILEAHYGQRPIIYTSVNYYRMFDFAHLNNEEFWLRSTAHVPSVAFPGQNWVFWQYSATGRIPGVDGNIDVNTFGGSAQDWNNWYQRRAIN